MMPFTLYPGVLTRDVPTRWGIYAAGIEVAVVQDSGDEFVVCLGYVSDRQLNARVPREYVAIGLDAERPRVARCWVCECETLAAKPATRCPLCEARFVRAREATTNSREAVAS